MTPSAAGLLLTSNEAMLVNRRALQHAWGWFLAAGLITMLVGLFAFVQSFTATEAFIEVLGYCFIVVSLMQIMQSVFSRSRFGVVVPHLVLAVVYGVVGTLILVQPFTAARSLTLILAVFFLVEGAVDLSKAFNRHHPTRGWNIISGLLDLLLAFLIFAQWPVSALWMIGLYVGANLLINGSEMVHLAFALRTPTPDAARPPLMGSKPLGQM